MASRRCAVATKCSHCVAVHAVGAHCVGVGNDPTVATAAPHNMCELGMPLVLKGILHPDDARRAVELGVDGVVVSTHGV